MDNFTEIISISPQSIIKTGKLYPQIALDNLSEETMMTRFALLSLDRRGNLKLYTFASRDLANAHRHLRTRVQCGGGGLKKDDKLLNSFFSLVVWLYSANLIK